MPKKRGGITGKRRPRTQAELSQMVKTRNAKAEAARKVKKPVKRTQKGK